MAHALPAYGQQPAVQLSYLQPNPALGPVLSRDQIGDITDIVDEVKDTGVTAKEYLVKSIARIIVGVVLVAFGAMALATPGAGAIGILAIIAGSFLISEGGYDLYRAYKENNMSVIKDATADRVNGLFSNQFTPPRFRQPQLVAPRGAYNPYGYQPAAPQAYNPYGYQPAAPQPLVAAPVVAHDPYGN